MEKPTYSEEFKEQALCKCILSSRRSLNKMKEITYSASL